MSIRREDTTALSPREKRVVLARLLRHTGRSTGGIYPLSLGQQALWFIYRQAPQSWAYHVVFSARLSAPVDSSVLAHAFQILVMRHTALRTIFITNNGTPVQKIQDHAPVDFKVVDIPATGAATLHDHLQAESRRPFDLEVGPVLRVRLFVRTPNNAVLIFATHHIAIDFWSLGVILKELRTLYPALQAGMPTPLAPPSSQYADYLRWQTSFLAGPDGEKSWLYWQQQLKDAVATLDLPLDRPRPAVQTYRGTSHPFRLSVPLTQSLQVLGQTEGLTLYMILLSALQILLFRYSGQNDILVGSPIACRSRPQFREVVGYCANPVVLRGIFPGGLTVRGFLEQVRATVLGALRHADYPFPLLVQRLQLTRDASRSPLFQVCMVLQTLMHQEELLACFLPDVPNPSSIAFGPLRLEPYPLPQQEGQFDITFEMAEIQSALCGVLQYNHDLFDAATMKRMARHFQVILEGITAHLDQPIATLPLLTAAERHEILVVSNETETAYPDAHGVHHLFEAQVLLTPDAIAIVCGAASYSYRQLNEDANRLAHFLHNALGVQPGTLIGLCVERSVDMMVGLWGILKAGCAYVPLDPAHPSERLNFMLEDTQVPVVLIQQPVRGRISPPCATVVCLDADWPHLAKQPIRNPNVNITSAYGAYVIYTSGSTGRPKGVWLSHRSLVNYLAWCVPAYGVAAGQGALVHSSLAFDLTITGLFAPLLVGKAVTLLPASPDSDAMGMVVQEQPDFSLIKMTPAHLTLLNQQLPPSRAAGVARTFVIGGDVLRPEQIARWQQAAPDTELVNEYGPTETVVGCCVYRVPAEPSSGVSIPIGRPIANTQLYVLDAQLHPVPIGVPGELYIGGDGVAMGYLNRAALTASAFIPHPFRSKPGARLYKTGDLVRRLPSGDLVFLGRTDHQVKLHGFRIELGEIENCLCQHPAIQAAIVLLREDQPGEPCLVGYVVPCCQSAPTSSELRQMLAGHLPYYMLPSYIVILESLPLTSNGKVDRTALPVPTAQMAPLPSRVRLGTRSPLVAQLTAIWQQILGVEQVELDDNFFELGGHSLQAMQLVLRLSAIVQQEVSIHTLLLHPTIASLATVLDMEITSVQSPSRGLAERDDSIAVPSPALRPTSAHTAFERRDLHGLFDSGELPPVDAAALAYFPHTLIAQTGVSREALLQRWGAHCPQVVSTLTMPLGRIALIALPCLDRDLYRDPATLMQQAYEALVLAKRIGARVVSLTGLIPSATENGRRFVTALPMRHESPQVSTGHATTTAAMVLTLNRLLQTSGRDLSQERVGYLGLGSIGLATLRLMLQCLPHPAELVLCDVYSRRHHLERIQQMIRRETGYQGAVRLLISRPEVPAAFYAATLIIGATNMPNVLDVSLLQPGTMMIDDSAPHCFDPEQARLRLQANGDILFTEGGALRSSNPIAECRYVPDAVAQTMTAEQLDTAFVRHDPYEIMGCTLSGLLSAHFAALPPAVGRIGPDHSRQHYAVLQSLGFQAAHLHCEGHVLAADILKSFRQQFGTLKADVFT